MMKLARIRIKGVAPLRAILMITFLVLTSLQPGIFAAANAAGFHTDGGLGLSTGASVLHIHGDGDAQHHHAAAGEDDHAGQHGMKTGKDKSCEIQCAPVLAVPVECPAIAEPELRCFPPAEVSVLPPGHYAEFIQPPRRVN